MFNELCEINKNSKEKKSGNYAKINQWTILFYELEMIEAAKKITHKTVWIKQEEKRTLFLNPSMFPCDIQVIFSMWHEDSKLNMSI